MCELSLKKYIGIPTQYLSGRLNGHKQHKRKIKNKNFFLFTHKPNYTSVVKTGPK